MGDEKAPHPALKWIHLALACIVLCAIICAIIFGSIYGSKELSRKPPVPDIELASMDFTVLNITNTSLSAKWDLSIRIPDNLPSRYICLQGDFQASFLYKNITLATSSPLHYYDLKFYQPQVLTISAVISEKDIDGLVGKDIIEDIKVKREVQFVSRFLLTDCRKGTTGFMSYACGEATLRFEPESDMKASVFGKHPKCVNL